MPVPTFFPNDWREEGSALGDDGLLYTRLTGSALITATPSGSASGLPLLDQNGAALTIPAASIVTDIKFRYFNAAGNPIILSTAGVLKVALAANADATSASVAAAVGRTGGTGAALAAATSFAADTAGSSAITLGGSVANASAAPLLLFARDAAAAGTANYNMSCADGRGLVLVELFCQTRAVASRRPGYTLSQAIETAISPVIS